MVYMLLCCYGDCNSLQSNVRNVTDSNIGWLALLQPPVLWPPVMIATGICYPIELARPILSLTHQGTGVWGNNFQ